MLARRRGWRLGVGAGEPEAHVEQLLHGCAGFGFRRGFGGVDGAVADIFQKISFEENGLANGGA